MRCFSAEGDFAGKVEKTSTSFAFLGLSVRDEGCKLAARGQTEEVRACASARAGACGLLRRLCSRACESAAVMQRGVPVSGGDHAAAAFGGACAAAALP